MKREGTLKAIEELELGVAQVKAVADMMVTVAYEGFQSQGAVPGVASMSGQKHGMVGGGLSVKDQRVHRDLERMGDEVGRKAMELQAIAAKYQRAVYEGLPGEPISQEMLENLEEWEKRRGRR